MKFIHIADVHLGAAPDAGRAFTESRPQELWGTFEYVVRECEEQQTDLLLIAGDLFHRQPLMRELKEANYFFSELTHTKVVLIAGNHDYIKNDSYYRTFEWSENVYPLFGEAIEYFEFPELETAVYGMSYHRREIREPVYDDLRACGVQKYEILLAHGGDEKHIPIDRRSLERSGFDYIALGHIHKPHAVLKNRAVYPGALEPVDKNDVGPHGYIKGEISDGGVKIQWIPCAMRNYVQEVIEVGANDTSGSVKGKIRKLINEQGNNNIYKITLSGSRDSDVEFDIRHMNETGNVLEIVDETYPSYDFERLRKENKGNLIGRYIELFGEGADAKEKSGNVEYQALCYGVEALLKSR